MQTRQVHGLCWVAVLNEAVQESSASVVGIVEVAVRPLSAWPTPKGAVPYVSNLAVAPAYRRQGIAFQLLMHCEQSVKDWGFDELYLYAMADNRAAQRLYTKIGYRVQSQPLPWFLNLTHPQQVLWRKRLLV
nr:N-acetyltransferase [Petrachloros mirabilis]